MIEAIFGCISFFVVVVLLLNVLVKAIKEQEKEEKRKNDAFVFACLAIGEYYSQKNKVLKEIFKNGNR